MNRNSIAMNSKRDSIKPKLIQIEEIVGINDKNERKKLLNELISHLLLDNCIENKCHNLSKTLQELTSNLTQFMSCDESIDRLMAEFNWTQINDNNVENSFCHLICESINLKPFKCVHILETVIIPKFLGFKQFKENEINSQEIIVFDKIHSLLCQIKIAKFESILLRTIEKKFPKGVQLTIRSNACYVYNVIKIYDYVSDKEKLLSVLLIKLLWTDSMITPEKIPSQQEMFTIDDCNQHKSDRNVFTYIQILDLSMELIFKFIDNKTADLNSDQSLQLFQLFQLIFAKIIINSENCHHIQYIMFYFCSISEQFCSEFIQTLWRMGLNNDLPLKIREKALYYMLSLIKNANFVTIKTVMSFMDMTSLWIHSYIDSNDSIKEKLTSEDAIFYVLCQIFFDIFCSFHNEFNTLNLKRFKVMNFQRIIKCNLNPLSFCSRDIESNFICIIRHHQIGYCHQNAKRDEERLNQFPFDHLNGFKGFGFYYLQKSYTKIEEICKQSMNGENNVTKEIEKYNRFNSDESDATIGSYKMSFSPSKTLLYDLLSDSSTNEQMDFD